MAIEIERKFLVKGDFHPFVESSEKIIQGYLHHSGKSVVRLRICQDRARLGIKSQSAPGSISRMEYEYDIPLEDAQAMLPLCLGHIIEKTRHYVYYLHRLWEIDVFLNANEGLVVAEIELNREDEHFLLPPWIGEEVTHDPKYYNSSLSVLPYRDWHRDQPAE